MRCTQCRATVRVERRNYDYKECGLPNVTLVNVPVGNCPECGREYLSLPRVSLLHRTISKAIVSKPHAMTAAEVCFLRKTLGWSNSDFASWMGVREETVSRWQNGAQIPPAEDRLLRMLVVGAEPIRDYSLEVLRNIAPESVPVRLKLKECESRGWCLATG